MLNGECAKIEVENCLEGVKNNTKKCSQCVDRFYVYQETSCVPIKIANCVKPVYKDNDTKCDKCALGYVSNQEFTKCGALPEGCLLGFYFSNVMCVLCNEMGGYYATDVTGAVQKTYILTFNGQVCTKYNNQNQNKNQVIFNAKSF